MQLPEVPPQYSHVVMIEVLLQALFYPRLDWREQQWVAALILQMLLRQAQIQGRVLLLKADLKADLKCADVPCHWKQFLSMR
jgi:hypothetical protein